MFVPDIQPCNIVQDGSQAEQKDLMWRESMRFTRQDFQRIGFDAQGMKHGEFPIFPPGMPGFKLVVLSFEGSDQAGTSCSKNI